MKSTIQRKILIFVTSIVIVAISVLGIMSYIKTDSIMDKSLQEQSFKVIQTVDFTLNKFMTNMESTINLIDDINILKNNPNSIEEENMIKYFDSIVKSNTDISTVFLGTKDKKTYINSNVKLPEGYDPTSRGWYQKAIETKALIWTEPYIDAFTGKLAITVAKPILINNEVVGVCGLDILLDTVTDFISSIKLGQTGYFTIADANNVILVHTSKDLIGKEIPNPELKDAISKNKKGSLNYTYDKVKKHAIYDTLSKTGWKIIGIIEYKESKANSTAILMNTVISGVIVLLVLIIIGSFITGTITKDIRNLLLEVQKMSQGDFTVRANIKSKDEIGVLAKEFNKMAEELSKLIKGAQNICVKVMEKSQTLKSTSDETVKSSEEVAKTIEQITQATAEQAMNTSIGSDTATKLAESMDLVHSSIGKVVQLCNDTKNTNEYGSKVVKELIEITEESNNSAGKVKIAIDEIDNSAKQIDTIIETINSIASQTNLLALNASIEAARAGEAGRGFAVVAEEIRKLAEQSTYSTNNIRSIIEKVQNQTQNAVSEMTNAKVIVDKQVESVGITEKSFDEINHSINTLLNSVYEIEKLNKEMFERKNEILDVIEGIAAGAEETSASTEEISASTEEQLAVMMEVGNITRELTETAEELVDEISKFKIENTN